MASPELERLWADPRHWSSPGIYRCVDDPRVFVPKRRRWAGWTINFAHPLALLVLAGTAVIAAGPPLLLLVLGRATPGRVLMAVLVSAVVLSAVAIWESERQRR